MFNSYTSSHTAQYKTNTNERGKILNVELVSMATELNRIVDCMMIRYGFTGTNLEFIDTDKLILDEKFLSTYIKCKSDFESLGICINRHSLDVLVNIQKELKIRKGKARYEAALKAGVEGEQLLSHKVKYLPSNDYSVFTNKGQHMYIKFNDLSNEVDCMVLSRNQRRLFVLESKYWHGTLHRYSNQCWKRTSSNNTEYEIPSPFSQLENYQRLLEQLLSDYDILVSPILVLTNPVGGQFIDDSIEPCKYPIIHLYDLLDHIDSYLDRTPMDDDEYYGAISFLTEHIDYGLAEYDDSPNSAE